MADPAGERRGQMTLDDDDIDDEAALDVWLTRLEPGSLVMWDPPAALMEKVRTLSAPTGAVYELLHWRSILLGRMTLFASMPFLSLFGISLAQRDVALGSLLLAGLLT